MFKDTMLKLPPAKFRRSPHQGVNIAVLRSLFARSVREGQSKVSGALFTL